MIQIPNSVLSGLIRHIPTLIAQIPPGQRNTKVVNAMRLTKLLINKLKKIENEHKRNQDRRE